MRLDNIPIGVQLYTVREDYKLNPEGTLKALSNMGYRGVEFDGDEKNNFKASRLNEALAAADLQCFGLLSGWAEMQMDTYEETLKFSEALNNRKIAIGSAPVEMLADSTGLKAVIQHLNIMHDIARKAGFQFGYHNHASDFVMVDGQTAWDHIFNNTPDDFLMVLDTGNALAGGAHSIPILEKFPNRSPWIHIKPYCCANGGYDTMIGEDDFDWHKLLTACVELGGAEVLTIEYGRRVRYQPLYGAKLCIERLREYIANIPIPYELPVHKSL